MAEKFKQCPSDIVFHGECSLMEKQLFDLFILGIGAEWENNQIKESQRQWQRNRRR